MTLTQSRDPYGYKKLLVYSKAEDLQAACAELTSHFPSFSHSAPPTLPPDSLAPSTSFSHSPHFKTLSALQDQMDRSARSVKQNIVEGWKRNSTKEYHQFLGFSLGANAELEEDCNDIIKGIYKDLMGIKGVMGETPLSLDEVERLPFYPLNPILPPIVQLKLRCKELNLLITKLQSSLEIKMKEGDGVLKAAWGSGERGKGGQAWLDGAIAKAGLVRLPDGQLVPKGEEKGLKGKKEKTV